MCYVGRATKILGATRAASPHVELSTGLLAKSVRTGNMRAMRPSVFYDGGDPTAMRFRRTA